MPVITAAFIVQVTSKLGLSFALPSSVSVFMSQHVDSTLFRTGKTNIWGRCGRCGVSWHPRNRTMPCWHHDFDCVRLWPQYSIFDCDSIIVSLLPESLLELTFFNIISKFDTK